jgi:hypothetical protein
MVHRAIFRSNNNKRSLNTIVLKKPLGKTTLPAADTNAIRISKMSPVFMEEIIR